MTISDIQSIMRNNDIPPKVIIHLLQQGIESERIQSQINEAIGQPNHDEMIRMLQGERFLLILSTSRLT